MKWFMAGVVMGLMVLGMVAHLCDRFGEAQWYMLEACAVAALGGLVCRREEGSGKWKVERGTGIGPQETWPQGHVVIGPHDERAGSFCCTPIEVPTGKMPWEPGCYADRMKTLIKACSPCSKCGVPVESPETVCSRCAEAAREAPGMPGRYAAGVASRQVPVDREPTPTPAPPPKGK